MNSPPPTRRYTPSLRSDPLEHVDQTPARTHRISLLQRLEHFTWAWFTLPMSTSGLALVLYHIPFRFRGLDQLGIIVFLASLAMFLACCICIAIRFLRFRWTLKMSLLHPTESLYVSAALVSTGVIIVASQAFGGSVGKWMVSAMRIAFWAYVSIATVWTVGIHMVIWNTQTHTVGRMTPLWAFPIYPMLLCAPMAGAIAPSQTREHALEMLFAALAAQGVGFMIAFMMYSAYFHRLMTRKLPRAVARPGMFISVGPSAFTVIGIMELGGVVEERVVGMLALALGVWLWGLACWFFLLSMAANVWTAEKGRLKFSLGWWAFVFPNSALTLATLAIGKELESQAMNVLGTALGVSLVVVWFGVLGATVRAVVKKDVLWRGVGEDRDEGGFRNPKRLAVGKIEEGPV